MNTFTSGLGSDGPENVPVLSPEGLGHYRIRIHARGRDTAVDMTTDEPVEHYLVQSWSAPPAAEVLTSTQMPTEPSGGTDHIEPLRVRTNRT